MFYPSTEHLWTSVKLMMALSFSLAFYMIIRKMLEYLQIEAKRKRIDSIDSLLKHFLNSPNAKTKHRMLKVVSSARLEELSHILDKAKSYPETESKRWLYNSILGSTKFNKIQRIALSSRFKGQRTIAIKILGKLRSDKFVLPLSDIIKKSKQPDIIYSAIQALAEINSELSVEVIISLLGTGKFSNSKIVSTLETLNRSLLGQSIERQNDASGTVRFWVANLLGNSKNLSSSEALTKMLKDRDPNVRAAACESIGMIGNNEAVPLLHDMLEDNFWFVRLHAIKSLGNFLSPESIDKIVPSLSDKNWWVRQNAKSALKKFGTKITPYMYPVLKDKDRFARNSAVEILEDTGAADMVFNKVITSNVSDEKTYAHFVDFIKAEAFFWLKSRLNDVSDEKRKTMLKLMDEEFITVDKNE